MLKISSTSQIFDKIVNLISDKRHKIILRYCVLYVKQAKIQMMMVNVWLILVRQTGHVHPKHQTKQYCLQKLRLSWYLESFLEFYHYKDGNFLWLSHNSCVPNRCLIRAGRINGCMNEYKEIYIKGMLECVEQQNIGDILLFHQW